ncbi:hypothetical protein V6N11_009772 [Hibiscus sabdariffa]|uniref:Uncharacterized protein n=1 Tax=Hibiscus sabdariffa TaxID=183260 RepID=A0ABR2P6D6_9ROSI
MEESRTFSEEQRREGGAGAFMVYLYFRFEKNQFAEHTAPDRRSQPENRWLREEADVLGSRSQGIGKSDGILFPNLPDNYGRNFRQGLKGDSSLMEKSTGDISGRSSSQMDFQMGLVSEDSPMVQPECNKRVRTHNLAVVVSKQPDSTSISFSSLLAGLQEQARHDQ